MTETSSPAISIIVPVLNEALLIETFLQVLRQRAPGAEIIVADGGSSDGTCQIAQPLCDRVFSTRANRGAQMNAGASVARGEILWFLHADATVPAGCLDHINCVMADPEVAAGFFRIRLPRHQWIYRLTDSFAHYIGLMLRIRCGDHGLFCRRNIFETTGGFPEVSLMEDADLFRKLYRKGRVVVIPHRIVISPRRFESIGPSRLTFFFGLIGLLYFLGAPRRLLESLYHRACCRS